MPPMTARATTQDQETPSILQRDILSAGADFVANHDRTGIPKANKKDKHQFLDGSVDIDGCNGIRANTGIDRVIGRNPQRPQHLVDRSR